MMPWQLLRGVLVVLSLGVCSLCAGSAAVHEKAVMRRDVSDPLHGMIDKDGGLIIPKEGNYFVYSQVSFSDSDVFQHAVTLSRKKYLKNVTLMQSRKYPKESGSNSFLSGIFHLYEHDRIFVTVSNTNTSKIIQNNNYFGAFML